MRNDDMRYDGPSRLVPLHDLKDFKVAKEDPDARGWKVIGADGEKFGKVKDLIVDPQAMKARYLSVEVDRRLLNIDENRELLVPIGAATLDREDDKVFVPFIDRNSIGSYPAYQGGVITDDYEYAVREAITNPGQDPSASGNYTRVGTSPDMASRPISNDFYEHEHFNEEKFYNPDQRNTRAGSDVERQQERKDAFDEDRSRNDTGAKHYTLGTWDQGTASGPKNVEESISTIERLEQMRERGTITEEEFNVLKKRALDI
jgi:photosynthetic reaction center H subunit